MQPIPPPQQPPQPAPWQPQQPWPQPQYAYPPPPPKSSAGKTVAIVVVVLVIVVVVVIAVAAILLASLNPFLPGNSFSAAVSHGSANNWTVVVLTTPSGLHPSGVTLTIRDSTGAATNVTRVAFSFINPSTWSSYHVVYEAANPLTSDISTGDQLKISELVYPQGCVITIEDPSGVLYSRSLG